MKKIRELFPLNDRARLIISACTVAAVLVAAMLVPLAFRSAENSTEQREDAVSAGKAAMFAAYWNEAPGMENIRAEKPESVSEKQDTFCETVMQTLTARCINDLGLESTSPTGREYTVLRDGTGTELPLCRMWLEARGDWQNWLDVCFDSTTGELYYLYLSRECLSNARSYADGAAADAAYIADALAREFGWTLRYLSSDGAGGGTAVFSDGDETLCYQIDCKVYDTLTDIRLCCR